MSDDEQAYIQALALGLDPAWRRRDRRRAPRRRLRASRRPTRPPSVDGVRTHQLLVDRARAGRRPPALADGADRSMPSRRPRPRLLRAGPRPLADRPPLAPRADRAVAVRRASRPTRSSRCSAASARATSSSTRSPSRPTGTSSRKEARQGVMNEHMRVGHEYPTIRQVLAYSFGLDRPGLRRRLRDRRPASRSATSSGPCAAPRAGARRSATRRSCSGIHRPIDEILGAAGRRR